MFQSPQRSVAMAEFHAWLLMEIFECDVQIRHECGWFWNFVPCQKNNADCALCMPGTPEHITMYRQV